MTKWFHLNPHSILASIHHTTSSLHMYMYMYTHVQVHSNYRCVHVMYKIHVSCAHHVEYMYMYMRRIYSKKLPQTICLTHNHSLQCFPLQYWYMYIQYIVHVPRYNRSRHSSVPLIPDVDVEATDSQAGMNVLPTCILRLLGINVSYMYNYMYVLVVCSPFCGLHLFLFFLPSFFVVLHTHTHTCTCTVHERLGQNACIHVHVHVYTRRCM